MSLADAKTSQLSDQGSAEPLRSTPMAQRSTGEDPGTDPGEPAQPVLRRGAQQAVLEPLALCRRK